MFRRIFALMGKEFIQIKRDKRTLAMIIAIPVIWLVMFGYAADFNVHHLKLIIRNESQSVLATTLADAFAKADSFTIVGENLPDDAAIKEELRLDRADLAILIPPGFGEIGKDASIRVLVDGADFFSAQSATGLIQKTLQTAQNDLEAQLSQRMLLPIRLPRLVPDIEFLYNPDVKSSIFMIPGLAAMVILFITVLMTALGVVRERERGTLEQLVVSPIRPLELMVGKIIPYALVGLLDFTLVLLAAIYIFGVPFAGNLVVFYGISLFFLLSALGIGLVASAAAQNQQQAMQMAMFAVFPQMLISGVIFPIEAMPKPIVALSKIFPLTYFTPIARGMFVKGLGLETLRPQAIALVIYGLVMIVAASIVFRRKLD